MKTQHITSALALSLVLAAPLQAQAVRNDTINTDSPPSQPVPVVTTTQPATFAAPEDDDVVFLSRFEVSAATNRGYFAPTSLAGSRINTNLEDVGAAITVVTKEFLRDTGATDNLTLLSYTPNTEVGGAFGNFRNASTGQDQNESGNLTNPNGTNRVRGLTSADGTRNFFRSSIPWDGYNVDRVDMIRGPSAILFGLGSPAGIINETSKTAQHNKNFGTFEFRFGSYDSNRVSLDWNQNLLRNELSVRLNLLRNHNEYRQDPAYSTDRRFAATLRYDPRWANTDSIKTTLRLNFEAGSIKSNNPRTITPADQITQWWATGKSVAGYQNLNHQGYDPRMALTYTPFYDASGSNGYYKYQSANQWENQGQFGNNRQFLPALAGNSSVPYPGGSSLNPNFSPWLNTLDAMAGGMWIVTNAGQVVPAGGVGQIPEINRLANAMNSTGQPIGGNLAGNYSYARRLAVASRGFWGNGPNRSETDAPYGGYGVWKTDTLKDASLFDFYNKLLDGDNKKEWQNFNDFSAFFNQSFFNNKLGYELAYDHQNLRRGQYSFDGGGVIYVDINYNNIDGTPNQHYGEPYIQTSNIQNNHSTDITLDSARFTAFFEHDFNEGKRANWLRKLLGKHTFTGLVSTETYKTDARDFSRYALAQDAIGLMSANTRVSDAARQLITTIYLGPSLANASTYQGASIPRAGGQLQIPSTIAWNYFDSHWTGPTNDPDYYGSTWKNPYNNANSFQFQNPANYAGMTTANVSILNADDNRAALTRAGRLSKRKVESMALSWQASLWDGAMVGLFGLRQDHVKSWSLGNMERSATNPAGTLDPVYGTLILENYNLGNPNTALQSMTENSKSWSVVAKLNKFAKDKLPININLYYNYSNNFQVPDNIGNDIYGNPHPVPTGETKEIGVVLSTKDQRFVLKVNKYDTRQKNVINNGGLSTWFFFDATTPDNNFIARNENRIDRFQYHMTDLPTAANAQVVYLDDVQPPVASWGFGLKQSGTFLETQEHSDTTRMATVAAWRAFCEEPFVQKLLDAWGYDLSGPTGSGAGKTPVANFGATRDQVSKGWEVELTANPMKNWRMSLNIAKTKATSLNVGGAAFIEFVTGATSYYNRRLVPTTASDPNAMAVNDGFYRNGSPGQMYYFRWATDAEIDSDRNTIGPDGQPLLRSNSANSGNDIYNKTYAGIGGIPTWTGGAGDYSTGARNGSTASWNGNFLASYNALKQLEGNYSSELRPWRFNFVTSYDFTEGGLKGLTVGGGYRWQDRNVIGYPIILLPVEAGVRSQESIVYDIDHPYYGPRLSSFDFWIAYQRKLSPKLTWRIQLNVRDAFAGKKLIPLSTQPDGTVAAWGIAPSQTWMITNTLMF